MVSSLDGQTSAKVMSPDQQKSTEFSSLDQDTSQKTSVPDNSLDFEVLETVCPLETIESIHVTSPGPVDTSEKDLIEQTIQVSLTNQKKSMQPLLCEYCT